MIRRPPRSTRTEHSFPTRRSSDLVGRRKAGHRPQALGDALRFRHDRQIVVVVVRNHFDVVWNRLRRADDLHWLLLEIARAIEAGDENRDTAVGFRSEEHTSELQSLMRNSYAVFRLNKKNHTTT